MSPKKNKAIARQLYDEVFNQGKLDMVDQLVAPDAIEHEEFPGIRGTTPEKLKQFVTTCRSGFPDLQLSVEDIIAEGDKVVCRIVSRGTHHGEFLA